MKIFQDRLKELRKSRLLSQKQLALILKTNNSSVCDWECGRTQPDLETIVQIAAYFEVSADYLLGLEDEAGAKTYIRDSFNNFTNSGTIKF